MEEEKLSKKYGCDGRCYTPTSMCPRVETCPETRFREFLAVFVLVAGLALMPIAAVVGIVSIVMSLF